MPKISLAGFTDPVRRPRYILWSGLGLLVLAAVVIVSLGITSTRWFCSEACHKVQDDAIIAYQRSTHAEIRCMACHMPVGTNPLAFLLHKAENLGELPPTITNTYELPINPESELALTMPSKQCTQCHDPEKRVTTPSAGVLMDHAPHAEKGVDCTICHNRIAHNEDFKLTLSNPDGTPSHKHEQFMTMTACFRCHSQGETPEGGLKAPGACSACHPPEFQLKPASHLEPGFYPEGHAKLASIETSRSRAASASAAVRGAEGEQATAEQRQQEATETLGPGLVDVKTINECYTCHSEKFCSDCHGLPMPHPEGFRKTHGVLGKKNPKSCEMCHGDARYFCDACHHGTSLNVPYDAGTKWGTEHPATVQKVGASACFDCHNPTYCANCHVNGPPQN